MRIPAKLSQRLLRFAVIIPLVAFICVFTFVATSHAATVRVTGRITDQNGSGILNVQISAKDPSTGVVDFGPVSTLADGSYALDVNPGTYNILIQPPSSSNIASLVESNYAVTTDQVLNLQAHTFAGTLHSTSGVPAQHFHVTAGANSPAEVPNGDPAADEYTDSNGHFSLNLLSATYSLNILDQGGTTSDLPGEQQFSVSNIDLSQDVTVDFAVQPINITLKTTNASNVSTSVPFQVYAAGDVAQSGPYTLHGLTPTSTGHTDSSGTATVELINGEESSLQSGPGSSGLCAGVSSPWSCMGYEHVFSSGDTITIKAAPVAPTTINATVNACGQTVLSWPAVNGVNSYLLYRTSEDGSSSGVTTVVTGTSYTETVLSQPGTYLYVVFSLSDLNTVQNNGARIDNVNVNPTPVTPCAPSNLTATTPTRFPFLSWDATSGATSYNIYRNGTNIGSTTSTSYPDNSAPEGTDAYYVTAVNGDGESPPSNTVSVLVDRTAPTITYSVSPTPNSSGWNNSSPVTVTFTCTDNTGGSGIASCSAPQTESADGQYTLSGTAVDNAGNSSSVSVTVNLDQTAPTLGTPTWTNNPMTTTQTATVLVPVTDNLSGVSNGEYYLGTTDPGQGHGTAMTLNSGNLSASFSNLSVGVYTVNFRAKDNAGNWSPVTTDYLAVYNPTSQGLFSGANNFSSPAGADIASPTLTGLVHFGITARYGTGGQPTGNVSMNFKAGNINFVSSSISELVIANGMATLKGTGTINGSGSYTFLVTGIDSQQTGGGTIRFRIKDSLGNVVYDTQPGAADTAAPTVPVTGTVIVH